MYILGPFLIKQLFHSRLLDIRSALRASLAIYHLKSNARSWDYCLSLDSWRFCQQRMFWTLWRFSGWRLAKLASIESKRHLQHDSLLFLPLASRFATFWLGIAQKSKFLS